MILEDLWQGLYDTALAESIRSSAYAFPWLESVHVLAIALVFGSIAVADLRLLGLASVNRPVTQVLRDVLPITWIAFVVAVITGTGMFLSNVTEYVVNKPFQLKMLVLLLAGLNMLAFQLVTFRTVAAWDTARSTPPAARFAGAFSLLSWTGIVAFGRWIGFTIGF